MSDQNPPSQVEKEQAWLLMGGLIGDVRDLSVVGAISFAALAEFEIWPTFYSSTFVIASLGTAIATHKLSGRILSSSPPE